MEVGQGNIFILIAAILACVGTIVHILGPEFLILRPMRNTILTRGKFPALLKFLTVEDDQLNSNISWNYLRAFNHCVSLDGLQTSIVLICIYLGSLSEPGLLAKVTAIRFGAYGIIWTALVVMDIKNPLKAPQWMIFFGVAIFTYIGVR